MRGLGLVLWGLISSTIACNVHLGSGLASGPSIGSLAPRENLASSPVPAPLERSSAAAVARARPGAGRGAAANDAQSRHDDSLAQLCVDEINRYRATLGLPPLQRDRSGETCADQQVADDAAIDRMHGHFGRCKEGAQNSCWASPGRGDEFIKGCLKGMWDEGPGGGHYEAMRGNARSVACGFYRNPQGGYWSVQNFR